MGTISFSGLASGIDSASLIDALIEAREKQNESRKAEVEHLGQENDALEELNTKMLKLSSLVDRFRTVNAGGVLKRATSSDSTVATAVVGSSAISTTYNITVGTLAKNATASLEDTAGGENYTGSTDLMTEAGAGPYSITLDVGLGGDLVSSVFNITGTTTLQDFVDAVNSDATLSGRIAASIVNAGTTSSADYRVVLSSTYTGTSKGNLAVTIDAGLTDVALNGGTVSQATDASFTVDGLGTITRSSNVVSDLFTGMTLNLLKTGASTTISVGSDADGTGDLINQIAKQYNDIVEYVNENDLVTQDRNSRDGEITYGSLAKTKVDNNFLTDFREQLLEASSSSGTYVLSFADMGLSTNRDGTVTLDLEEFISKVGTDPTGAGEVLTSFADAVGGTLGTIYQYTKYAGNIDTAQDANNEEVENLQEKIAQVERGSDKVRESLERTFARLEQVTAKLQSDQSALSGILAGLG